METDDYQLFTGGDVATVTEMAANGNVVADAPPFSFDEVTKTLLWLSEQENPMEPIPIDQIGLVADGYRVTVP